MSQTSYNREMGAAFAGMKADIQNDRVESFTAKDAVDFGAALSSEAADAIFARMPVVNSNAIDFSVDLITGNIFNAAVDSITITPCTFTTDHATTMQEIVDTVNATVTTVTAEKTAPKEITVKKTNGAALTITGAAVTGGASQPTTTVTASTSDVFRGVALHTHKEPVGVGANAVAQYADGEQVNVLKAGQVWVPVTVAVAVDDTVYALKDGSGKFTNSPSDTLATGAKFKSATTGAGLAKIQLAVL